jgi:hypothetical protein
MLFWVKQGSFTCTIALWLRGHGHKGDGVCQETQGTKGGHLFEERISQIIISVAQRLEVLMIRKGN